jgi:RNA-binding motif protein, X-linked 2
MNPLTQIRNTQRASKAEIDLGIGDRSSWHARFKHSAYVFTGGLPFELTEGDVLAVFSQYGEVVDVHLVRDKTTGGRRSPFLLFVRFPSA